MNTFVNLPYSGGRDNFTPDQGFAARALTSQSALLRLTGRMISAYNDYRNLQALEAVPFDIRKDIGWPAPQKAERMN